MYQLLPDRYDLLNHFFEDPPPNAPMVQAFIQGVAPGRAFIDHPQTPRGCVVATNYSYAFFGGGPSATFHEKAIEALRREQRIHVVWKGGRVRLPRGPKPDQVVHRLEFRQRRDRGDNHLDALAHAPRSVEVCRINTRLFMRCEWRDEVVRAVGSASEFFTHGMGYAVMQEDEILAEAYAYFWAGDRAEIATITHDNHRRSGFATLACAHLIRACESMGMSTYWSCDADNEASLRLAARLGYTDEHSYRLLRFDRRIPGRRAAKAY